jgi:CubicO group peptidase (beta-lactamase class C family)
MYYATFLSKSLIKTKRVKMISKRNSKIAIIGISLTIIIFLGLFPWQILAYKYKDPDYWPDWDKWRIAEPETQGMNSNKIEEMYQFIDFFEINIQSMMIVRNGYIIDEEYLYNSIRREEKSYLWPFHTPDWDLHDGRLHHVWSVTKSVVSLLTGIVIDMGLLDLDTAFFDVFPDRWDPVKYYDYLTPTGDAKMNITVENLLTHTVGIYWDEFDGVTFWDWLYSGFAIDFYLTRPMQYPPGYSSPSEPPFLYDFFNYSSANQDLLSVMIANKTGMPLADFARKYLFKPLKIRDDEWFWMNTTSAWGTGDLAIKYQGGWGLCLSPRALARIGLMCLNEGKWRGRQVVPKDWISESTSVQLVPWYPAWIPTTYYGYLWWITPTEEWVPGNEYPDTKYYQAIGYLGQRIIVIPELDIVVVITSNEELDMWYYGSPLNYIVEQFIIPAVL